MSIVKQILEEDDRLENYLMTKRCDSMYLKAVFGFVIFLFLLMAIDSWHAGWLKADCIRTIAKTHSVDMNCLDASQLCIFE